MVTLCELGWRLMSINLYAGDERLDSFKIGRDGCRFVMSDCLYSATSMGS